MPPPDPQPAETAPWIVSLYTAVAAMWVLMLSTEVLLHLDGRVPPGLRWGLAALVALALGLLAWRVSGSVIAWYATPLGLRPGVKAVRAAAAGKPEGVSLLDRETDSLLRLWRHRPIRGLLVRRWPIAPNLEALAELEHGATVTTIAGRTYAIAAGVASVSENVVPVRRGEDGWEAVPEPKGHLWRYLRTSRLRSRLGVHHVTTEELMELAEQLRRAEPAPMEGDHEPA